ncbi:hypothetical protein BWQ96_08171 [Gracilariopsis chorda]|uniref:Uncharacterized protein n=1 Tax=Gracilariopsis chorda TaxID=448386 RepID=A0A2V3IIY8_9FLOR|nr:hypothetical protein BWQ96_08171 [Gracilariopsis chorda]|eukprot:PXF42065.1 hypothetical protein BWQ96_08171 [Gracilariopsis chorda]
MTSGESAVHIVSDLVLAMEGETDEVSDRNDGDDDQHGPCYDVEEVRLFDQLTGGDEPLATRAVEKADEDWFTNHVAATMGQERMHPASQSFQ